MFHLIVFFFFNAVTLFAIVVSAILVSFYGFGTSRQRFLNQVEADREMINGMCDALIVKYDLKDPDSQS